MEWNGHVTWWRWVMDEHGYSPFLLHLSFFPHSCLCLFATVSFAICSSFIRDPFHESFTYLNHIFWEDEFPWPVSISSILSFNFHPQKLHSTPQPRVFGWDPLTLLNAATDIHLNWPSPNRFTGPGGWIGWKLDDFFWGKSSIFEQLQT